MANFKECLKAVRDKMLLLFSPHQYRLAQIKDYRNKGIEISEEFKDYAGGIDKATKAKCRRAVRNKSFDLYGFYSVEWSEIDNRSFGEKQELYRQFYKGGSDHQETNAAARTRLLEIRHEKAIANAELNELYEKFLYSHTVYQKGRADDVEISTEEVPAEDAVGTPEYE